MEISDEALILTFAEKAEQDIKNIQKILLPQSVTELCLAEDGVELDYLKDPQAWMKSYTGHVMNFDEDDHYLEYVVGLLEVVVSASSDVDDQDEIYPPILLLEKIVTKEMLMQRRDPMRTSLRLQYRLRHYEKIEGSNNCNFDINISELERVAKEFAVSLINACVAPQEVKELMKLDDDTMFRDVLKSQNAELVASQLYQKLWEKAFWGEFCFSNKKSEQVNRGSIVLKSHAMFLLWNVIYLPVSLFLRCTHNKEKREKITRTIFTPFFSYLADVLNYTMMNAFLLTVILTTIPDLEKTQVLFEELKQGHILAKNNTNFEVISQGGDVMIKLPDPEISVIEWILWVCIFGRVLTEFYQASQKRGFKGKSKIKMYLHSFFNVADVILLLLLLSGAIVKLELCIRSHFYGVYQSVESSDHLIASHSLGLTTYLYSIGAVVALVNMLQIHTIHIPVVGPLIQSARETFAAATGLIFLFVFFILGFIVPMMGVFSVYRNIHDSNDFHYFSNLEDTVITLIWTMFGGLAANHRDNLYKVHDSVSTIFMVIIFLLYAIVVGVLCVNYITVIMIHVYNSVYANNHARWRFSQFEAIMDYNSVTNHGDSAMPFLIPFCIPYILYVFVTEPCREEKNIERDKDNPFARFLCQHRLRGQTDEEAAKG